MLSSRWPRSPSHGKCSKRFCGSSRSYGRSHHQRSRETFDVMHSRATDKKCVQMPGKMAGSDPRPSVVVTRGADSGQHLASVLQEGRENANIDAGLGFIWRISAHTGLIPHRLRVLCPERQILYLYSITKHAMRRSADEIGANFDFISAESV